MSEKWEESPWVARIARADVPCSSKNVGDGSACTLLARYHYEGRLGGFDVCGRHLITDYVHAFEGHAIQEFFKRGSRR